jgi:hypothetical protein
MVTSAFREHRAPLDQREARAPLDPRLAAEHEDAMARMRAALSERYGAPVAVDADLSPGWEAPDE